MKPSEQFVNEVELDTLVVALLASCGCYEPLESCPLPLPSCLSSPADISQVQKLLRRGNIREATGLLEKRYPAFLEAHADVAARLKIQQFVEELRETKGTLTQNTERYIKEELKFCTHSCDQQDLLKNALLLLIAPSPEQLPTTNALWDTSRREDLAAFVTYSLISFSERQSSTCQNDDCKIHISGALRLSVLLCYLIAVHNSYHIFHPEEPRYEEIEQLLLPDRLLWTEDDSGVDDIPIQRSEVGALSQAVGISWMEASRSIRMHGGNVQRALISQLRRMQLRSNLLFSLCVQYGEMRGLLPSRPEACGQVLWEIRCNIINFEIEIAEEVIQKHFPEQSFNPRINFLLGQCKCVRALIFKDIDRAYLLASKVLAPLTLDQPQLYCQFKDTMLCFLDSKNSLLLPQLQKPFLLSVAQQICASLAHTCKEKPPLLERVQYLLYTHTQWFRQQYTNDIFESYLSIPELKSASHPLFSDQPNLKEASLATHDAQDDAWYDESTIDMIMEFLNIDRAYAVTLVSSYESLDDIFANFF